MDDDLRESESGSEIKEEKVEKPSRINPVFLWTRDIIICLILVLLFRANVAEANYIPSISMEPTLKVNDRIIVDKLSKLWRPFRRGELVVFHPPKPYPENERWIKRIIGLPGETVDIIRGKVYINGRRLIEPYVQNIPEYSTGPTVLKKDNLKTKENEDEYYLLGDNRANSKDSHVWGTCPADRIIGRAVFRYWPLSNIGSLTHAWEQVKFSGNE